jgi:ABC-type metal ion transport system substrate-binding protein
MIEVNHTYLYPQRVYSEKYEGINHHLEGSSIFFNKNSKGVVAGMQR